MILGYALQWLLEEVPNDPLSEQKLAFMDLYLDDPNERALFNLCSSAPPSRSRRIFRHGGEWPERGG
jgi:hypothetical protein